MEIKADNTLSEILTKRSTGLTCSQVKDVVINIGTKPDPIDFESMDKSIENSITEMYKDNLNMRKKMIMEKERYIMSKNEKYNYKLIEWTEEDFEDVLKGAKALPIDSEDDDDNYYAKDIINPIDSDDENQPYSGVLLVWKNDDNTYSLTFFFGYYCGDYFYMEERSAAFGDDEFNSCLKYLVEKYSDTDIINKLIKDQMEKEKEKIMTEYKNYDMKFSRKGYGRIFVEKEEDVKKVEEIMRDIDPEEFGGYYPTGEYLGGNNERLVTTFSKENFKSIYVGKFDDMDMGEVLKRAWEKGIHCFAIFGKANITDGDW